MEYRLGLIQPLDNAQSTLAGIPWPIAPMPGSAQVWARGFKWRQEPSGTLEDLLAREPGF
jgi:hypothetical protein